MIKIIKKFQIKLTPFNATKNWNMSNTDNEDLLLHDTGSYADPEFPVALEFIDYGGFDDTPTENSECSITLEQQENDLVSTRIGLQKSGLFFPDLEPVNDDGTYKRMVYAQINTMFYNNYADPSKIWGINNIDFELSKTKRKLSDEFRLFDIPKNVYGDKIIPKSVTIRDYSTNDNFDIIDDGYGNLIAGPNLFSKVQVLGEFNNIFVEGSSSFCDDYWNNIYPPIIPGSSSYYGVESSEMDVGFIWGSADNLYTESANVSMGYLFGSIDSFTLYDNASISSTFLTGSLFDAITSQSAAESGSMAITFISGTLFSSSVYGGNYNDSSSISILFLSGSIDDLSKSTSSYETGSTTLSLWSSSIYTYAIPSDTQIEAYQQVISFYEGTRSLEAGGFATSSNGTIVPEP